MSFTYSGNPSNSDADFIRFMIGDTNAATPILQDAEITYIINSTEGMSTSYRLAVAFRAAATALAAKLVKRSLGPQSEDATKRYEYYTRLADKYEKIGSFSGVPPLKEYASELIFDKNMMANEI